MLFVNVRRIVLTIYMILFDSALFTIGTYLNNLLLNINGDQIINTL